MSSSKITLVAHAHFFKREDGTNFLSEICVMDVIYPWRSMLFLIKQEFSFETEKDRKMNLVISQTDSILPSNYQGNVSLQEVRAAIRAFVNEFDIVLVKDFMQQSLLTSVLGNVKQILMLDFAISHLWSEIRPKVHHIGCVHTSHYNKIDDRCCRQLCYELAIYVKENSAVVTRNENQIEWWDNDMLR